MIHMYTCTSVGERIIVSHALLRHGWGGVGGGGGKDSHE